jgi:hypothetical protein
LPKRPEWRLPPTSSLMTPPRPLRGLALTVLCFQRERYLRARAFRLIVLLRCGIPAVSSLPLRPEWESACSRVTWIPAEMTLPPALATFIRGCECDAKYERWSATLNRRTLRIGPTQVPPRACCGSALTNYHSTAPPQGRRINDNRRESQLKRSACPIDFGARTVTVAQFLMREGRISRLRGRSTDLENVGCNQH